MHRLIPSRPWGLPSGEESFSPQRPASGSSGYRGREATASEQMFRDEFGRITIETDGGGGRRGRASFEGQGETDSKVAVALGLIAAGLAAWGAKKKRGG